jgi:ATP-dependent DNA helicase RecQ
VSHWGHDFRPSYQRLAQWISSLSVRPPVAAFTATATPEVAKDMSAMLALRHPQIYVHGFARDNLALSVVTGVDKQDYLLAYMAKHQGEQGIIYTATRKEAEKVYGLLSKRGIRTAYYHAGLSAADRKLNQDRFRYDKVQVMVATNAFGMGIDKPNIRFVIHWQMPSDLESYYQEAGRAGRDGEPSECILLFSAQDMIVRRGLIEQTTEDPERLMIRLNKLYKMRNYVHTTHCYMQFIVQYFGERNVPPCGRCSVCLDDSEKEDVTIDAQKALSCVARMKGRFGLALVTKVLKGSLDKRVLQFQLDKLPTHGLLSTWPEKRISEFLYWLMDGGYLLSTEGKYPVVSISETALPVLRGAQKVMQKRSSIAKQAAYGEQRRKRAQTYDNGIEWSETDEVSNALFASLRNWRLQQATAEKVPPFMIFNDVTLRHISLLRPQTIERLKMVKGVGEAKLNKYGADILALLK